MPSTKEITEPRGAKSELYCMDRAFGHDWDEPTWHDGGEIKEGRKTIYIHHRRSRCVRCESERTEVYEQTSQYIEKVRNQYHYSDKYRDRNRMTSSEIHTALWKQAAA